MRIMHRLGRKILRGEGPGRMLLTNKKGNFLTLGTPNTSDFEGLFYHDSTRGTPIKILQDIRPEGCEAVEIVNAFSWYERVSRAGRSDGRWSSGTEGEQGLKEEKVVERFFMSSNAFLYEIEGFRGDVVLTFDCKRLYDDDDRGRMYDVSAKGERARVIYAKVDTRATPASPQYTVTTLLAATTENGATAAFLPVGDWRPFATPADAARGMAGERWVYDALRLSVDGPTRLLLTFSLDPTKAEEKLQYVLEHQDAVLDGIRKYPISRFGKFDIEFAVACNALDQLATFPKNKGCLGVCAGLPWFFQFWGRDEATSMRALLLQEQYSLCKDIGTRLLKDAAAGRTGAVDGEGQESVDMPGLACLRMTELLQELRRQRILHQFFTMDELSRLRDYGERILKRYAARADFYGFVTNGAQETWMDTLVPGDPGRPGIRVEIQAFHLAVYDLLLEIAQHAGGDVKRLRTERETLRKRIKDWFFDRRGFMRDGFFPDGSADERVRPNVFLAWYAAPDLLPKHDWLRVFDSLLAKLWLPWGGLASLDPQNPLFRDRHTGLGDASYHRGDSWRFLNNIAAMALFRTDPHRYEKHITAILEANRSDLLFFGSGHASELSDAAANAARGCWAQAWSAATFIELLHLLKNGER